MKKLKKLTLQRLTPEQMRSVQGGKVCCFSSNGRWFSADNDDVGAAWCDVWKGFGYQCDCISSSSAGLYYC